ncbi:L-serine ammonia-lyase [Coralliovum pocilloporae]|uniref:L-serine ammonia-lyase n=1 Tax=Coralliovum pocilloporae TaxID=3066369 RepID=UPI003306DA81
MDTEQKTQEVVSVFDLFKIGIGPSSSHSVGPMVAANRYCERLDDTGLFEKLDHVTVELYGSLALTGVGHGTDTATILGLLGERPDLIDTETVPGKLAEVYETGQLNLFGRKSVAFPKSAIEFKFGEFLPFHSNGMKFVARDAEGQELDSRIYYSIGGGFVVSEDETTSNEPPQLTVAALPHPFTTAVELLEIGRETGKSIAEIALANELALRDEDEVYKGLDRIWDVMQDCIRRGCRTEGILPGGLSVKRRAPTMKSRLQEQAESSYQDPVSILDWVNLYALAVNEENAAGGQVVTAPTNGAAGIIPAVLNYYRKLHPKATEQGVYTFLLTAAAIGVLYKRNASISGAEVGCQGEVGVACSMAAAGLTAALGGSNEQIENAAEIGMEHNLGLTCDPVGGLVQIPCIERNAMASVKAINATTLALKGDGSHHVSLDTVIETMWETGKDMLERYKETSQGGLAVKVGVHLPEC